MGFLHRSSKRSASARAQVGSPHDHLVSTDSLDHQGGVTATRVGQSTLQMWVDPENAQLPGVRTIVLGTGMTVFESHMSVWGSDTVGRLLVGRWTYVRYDPEQPGSCELDKERLASEFEPLFNGKQRLLIPKEVSDGWFASAAAGDGGAAAEVSPDPDATAPGP